MRNIRESLVFLITSILLFTPLSAGDLFQDAPVKLQVTAEQANVRAEPDIGSRILIQVPAPAVFSVLEKTGEWYHIRYVKETGDSLSGYVHESLVSVIRTDPDRAVPPVPEKLETTPRVKKTPPREERPNPVTPPETPPPRQEPTPARIQPAPRVSAPPIRGDFSLAGGIFSAVGGDINQGTKGLSDYYRDLLQSGRQGEARPLHLGWLFGGEMRYFLDGKLAVGAGVAFLSGRRESAVSFSSGERLAVRPQVRAVPFRFFATYSLMPGFYLKGGLEYTFAECAYSYRYEQEETWQEWQGEAQGHGPGLLGGFGYSHPLTDRLELFVEALGRLSKISRFEGKDLYRDEEGREVEEEGTLYLYSVQSAGEATHQLLFIRDRLPSEAGVSNPTPAGLNLSGISLRAGLRIRF